MLPRFVAWLVIVLAFSTSASAGDGTGKKRDYAMPEQTVEVGLYLLSQRSFYDAPQRAVSLPVSWTRFASDSLDWRFEGWVSHVATRGDGWFSAVAGPGFTYWLDGDTAVKPFIRLGMARDLAAGRTFAIHGADVLVERAFPLRRGAPHEEHRLVILDVRLGYLAHETIGDRGGSFDHRFARAGLSYDWPLFPGSWDIAHRKRAKLTLGVEMQAGAGRTYDRLVFSTLSLRTESAAEGKLIRKLELTIGADAKGRRTLNVGLAQGF